jgi:hypothetical protein
MLKYLQKLALIAILTYPCLQLARQLLELRNTCRTAKFGLICFAVLFACVAGFWCSTRVLSVLASASLQTRTPVPLRSFGLADAIDTQRE